MIEDAERGGDPRPGQTVVALTTGGACLVAAERLLRERRPGQTVAIVVADSGMKYLSTDLWDAD